MQQFHHSPLRRRPWHRIIACLMIATLLTLCLLLTGCGGGAGDTDNPDTRASVNGQIALPAANAQQLRVLAGGNTPAPVNGTGFTIKLRDDATAALTAVNAQNEPVLMAVSPKPANGRGRVTRAGTPVTLDAASTAQAMVYLTPFLAQNDPADEATMLSLIAGLPETTTLTQAIVNAVTAHPNDTPLDDTAVKTALTNAVNAALDAAAQRMQQALTRNLFVDPDQASGVKVSIVTGSGDTRTFQIANSEKRWISAKMSSTGQSVLIPSTGGLLSLSSIYNLATGGDGSKKGTLTANVNDDTSDAITVYGLGFHNGMPDAGEIGNWALPAAATLVFDVGKPLVKILCCTPDVPDSIAMEILDALAHTADGMGIVSRIVTDFTNGQYLSGCLTFADWLVKKLLANNAVILVAILKFYFSYGAIQLSIEVGIAVVAFPVKIINAINNAVNLAQAFKALLVTNWKDEFTVIGSGTGEVVIRTRGQLPTRVSAVSAR